jgi:hypothetical protein
MFRTVVLVFAVMLAAAATAFAGNNKNPSSSWIGLSAAGAAPAATPVAGSNVTIYEGTTATAQPFVHLRCYQNGTAVSESWNAVFTPSTGSATFMLASSAWQAGAASCTATLENWDSYSSRGKVSTLASTSFDVSG